MAKVTKPGSNRQRKGKAALVQYLRNQGIPPGTIQREQAKGDKAMIRGVCGVTDNEYVAAGGSPAD